MFHVTTRSRRAGPIHIPSAILLTSDVNTFKRDNIHGAMTL